VHTPSARHPDAPPPPVLTSSTAAVPGQGGQPWLHSLLLVYWPGSSLVRRADNHADDDNTVGMCVGFVEQARRTKCLQWSPRFTMMRALATFAIIKQKQPGRGAESLGGHTRVCLDSWTDCGL